MWRYTIRPYLQNKYLEKNVLNLFIKLILFLSTFAWKCCIPVNFLAMHHMRLYLPIISIIAYYNNIIYIIIIIVHVWTIAAGAINNNKIS